MMVSTRRGAQFCNMDLVRSTDKFAKGGRDGCVAIVVLITPRTPQDAASSNNEASARVQLATRLELSIARCAGIIVP